MSLKAGIDVGSTTVKLIVIDEQGKTIYSKYERHYSDVKKAALQTLREAQKLVAEQPLSIAITGSMVVVQEARELLLIKWLLYLKQTQMESMN